MKTGDARQVHSAAFKAIGHKIWDLLAVAAAAGAAGDQGVDLHTKGFVYQHPAHTLGPPQALMAGEAQDMDSHLLHINGKDAGSLSGIHCKNQPMTGADFARLPDGQHGSAQVRSVEHHHRPGVGANQVLHLLGVQHAVAVGLGGVKGNALGRHLSQRPHQAVVLHRADDHMVSRFEQAFDDIV